MSWNITLKRSGPNAGRLVYRRRGDFEDQTASPHMRGLLTSLEALETELDGWYVGFRHPSPTSGGKVTELWAQYPGETVVHAGSVDELRDKVVAASKNLNL